MALPPTASLDTEHTPEAVDASWAFYGLHPTVSPDIASVSVTSQVNKVVCDPLILLFFFMQLVFGAKNVLLELSIGFGALELGDPIQHFSTEWLGTNTKPQIPIINSNPRNQHAF